MRNIISGLSQVTIKKAIVPNNVNNVDYWPEMKGAGYTLYWHYETTDPNTIPNIYWNIVIPPKNYLLTDYAALGTAISLAMNIEVAAPHVWPWNNASWVCGYNSTSKLWSFSESSYGADHNNIVFDFDQCPALAKFFGFWAQPWKTDSYNGGWIGQTPVDETYYFPAYYIVIPELSSEDSINKSWGGNDVVVASLTWPFPTSNEEYLTYMPSIEKTVHLPQPLNISSLTFYFKALMGGRLWSVPFHCLPWYVEIILDTIGTTENNNYEKGLY
jgi:hypothetical protein